MKKTIAILLIVILATMFLASCNSSDKGNYAPAASSVPSGGSMSGGSGSAPMAPPAPDLDYQSKNDMFDSGQSGGSGLVPITDTAAGGGLAEKIIYSVYADIETVKFDETIQMVYELLALNNAFIESSYIGGRNYAQSYYGYQTYRSANFTLRIPKDRLNAVTASLDSLGNVTSLRSDAENITSQFFDTQSRLNSYRTQEERLLDMLSKADNVPDMIAVEQRLADVRYNIETLTTTLNNWQSRVDYSSLTLYISEVEIFTEITPIHRTYWQQIGDGLQANTKGIGNFFKGLFSWIVISLPVLIVLAIVAAACVIIVKRRLRRMKKRDEERRAQMAQTNYNAQMTQPNANDVNK